MLSKILAKAALKAQKFQADFHFQKLELLSSNPSSKISITIKCGQQQIESLQRPKANYETELNESLTLVTSIFYEDFKQKYQEKLVQIDVNLHNGSLVNIIGYGRIDISQFATLAIEQAYENDIILVLEKSPEYQAKLNMRLSLKFSGNEENNSSLLKKLKNNSSQPSKGSPGLQQISKSIMSTGNQLKPKRSLTPTPKSSQHQTKSAILPKNTKELRESRAERSQSKGGKMEETRGKSANKFQQVANTVLLMKNSTTTIVRRTASKSPPPRKEGFKAMIIPGPMFQNKYSNVYEEKRSIEGKIQEIKEDKISFDEKLSGITKELDKKEGECEELLQKIKDYEMKNSKLRKDLEKNKAELKRTSDYIAFSINNKQEEGNTEKKKEVLLNEIDFGKEKLNELLGDFNRLSNEKTNLQADVVVMKQEVNDVNQTIQELNKINDDKNGIIQEMNQKQMDLKNEYMNLKTKQPNILNQSKINDLFSDSYRKQKELEVQSTNLSKKISEGNDEIIRRENNFFEQEGGIEVLKTQISEKTQERKDLQDKIKVLQEEVEILKAELPKKEQKKIEVLELTMAHQDGYVRTKQDIADIFNLVFEKGGDDLMDELDRFLN